MSKKSFRVPRKLKERFRLERALGRGGMGSVYLGTLPGTQRRCAVKVVSTRENPRHMKRIVREAKLMARVRHPHLIEVLDAGVEEDYPWIAMEFVDGRTMSRLRRDGYLADPDRVLRWVGQLGGAIAAMHREGVLHRDVKLGNMMIDRHGRPVLMDLGLAVHDDATRITRTGHLVGTVNYMAPELFLGDEPSEASDWWALGVCVHYVLEGKRPYEAEDIHKFAAQRAFEPPPPMTGPHKNHPLAEAARGMMVRDPARRLVGIEALVRVLQGEPFEPPPGLSVTMGNTLDLSSMDMSRTAGSRDLAPVGRAPAAAGVSRGVLYGVGTGLALLVSAAWFAGPDGAPVPRPGPGAPATVPAPPPPPAAPPVHPAVPPPGGKGVWRWALEEARAAPAAGPARLRALAQARARLARGDRAEGWRAAARLALTWAEVDDPRKGVREGWATRFGVGLRDLRAAPAPAGDEDWVRLTRAWDRREQAVAAAPRVPGPPPPVFPPEPPGPNMLWELRSFRAADFPEDRLAPWLAFGSSLPEGFDLTRWAGDLREHPFVILAGLRAWDRRLEPPPRRMARRLGGLAFRPGAGASRRLRWLWLEGETHRLWAAAWATRDRPGSPDPAPGWLAAVREGLGDDPVLTAVAAGEAGVAAGLVGAGKDARRRAPLAALGPRWGPLFAALAADPDRDLATVLRIRAGELETWARYGLLDCAGVEDRAGALRAEVDWQRVQALGAGGLFERAAPLRYREVLKLAELCRATRLTRGSPVQVIRYLDGWPE